MKQLLHGMFVAVYFGVLLALLPDAALAGTGDETADPATDLTTLSPEELMKVEVATVYSASKFEQKVTEAPASVSIVTADEIRKYGYRTLSDILRSLRSFNITYDRNYTFVGVRGFGRAGDYNSRILLQVDGPLWERCLFRCCQCHHQARGRSKRRGALRRGGELRHLQGARYLWKPVQERHGGVTFRLLLR